MADHSNTDPSNNSDDVHPSTDVLAQLERLVQRFSSIESRLQVLEHAKAAADAAEASATASAATAEEDTQQDEDVSPVQAKLTQELRAKGFSNFRFVRAPANYYDESLEFRMGILNAASTNHLCKSMIMENTRAHPSTDGWKDPNNSKYYIVIVQYTARLHAEKLKNFIHKLNSGKFGKQYFNMRVAPGDVSDALSGYEHNAVTPIACKTPLPIVISHKICALQPDDFWLGAGEVDLKVRLSAAQFVEQYRPFVVDCTYD